MTDQREPCVADRDPHPMRSTRRGFVRSAALGAAGLAAAGASPLASPAADAKQPKRKTKIRIGTLQGGRLDLEAGETVRFVLDGADGDKQAIPLHHPEIFDAVVPNLTLTGLRIIHELNS